MSDSGSTTPTTAGNYFVSNYPPYSFWSAEQLPHVEQLKQQQAEPGTPLGLYIHIPFCRRRCEFCFFKVYTDKSSAEVRRYLDAVLAELEAVARSPYIAGRSPDFVYFGGGTPSYLSSSQLEELFGAIQEHMGWEGVREVAFEAEPGTVKEGKLRTLRELGVTRLSIGIEHYDDEILELAGRAHRQAEIYTAMELARDQGFPQINIDLIAGMVGETEAGWRDCVDRTLALDPESITVYQMEVPHNTIIYRRMQDREDQVAPVADWDTKRRWVREAFGHFEDAGYEVGSAYTVYKGERTSFLYRDALWHGADMLGLGVSAFSHLGGVHVQNLADLETYQAAVEGGSSPHWRSYAMSPEERMWRLFCLQLKLGFVDPDWFRSRFGVDVLETFRQPLKEHQAAGWMQVSADGVRATREGLLRIDSLIPEYFPQHHRTTHVV